MTVKPKSDLLAAIHSPHDAAAVLDRLNSMLVPFYEPDDADTRTRLRSEFMLAMSRLPTWACLVGMDEAARTCERRPTPAHVVNLAKAAMRPIQDELARRDRIENQRLLDDTGPTWDERQRSLRLMEEIGFTPRRLDAVRAAPMARTIEEAVPEVEVKRPHWSEGQDPNSPAMRQLQEARNANRLVQDARRKDWKK